MSAVSHEPDNQFISHIKAIGLAIEHEDDAIAYCLNQHMEDLRELAFARLQTKYSDLFADYLDGRYTDLSATGKDRSLSRAFRRIWKYSFEKGVRTQNGDLVSYMTLLCEWEARKEVRLEKRRRELLAQRLHESWCVEREQTEAYKGDAISEQDVMEVLAATRQQLSNGMYPHTTRVLVAISEIYMSRSRLQARDLPRGPSVTQILDHINANGDIMNMAECKNALNVLRAVARRVLRENGWEMDLPISRFA